jgi:hypothetical protein
MPAPVGDSAARAQRQILGAEEDASLPSKEAQGASRSSGQFETSTAFPVSID